jgi:hypothetical protein
MCSDGTCCHWLAGGCDRVRVRQRRRALLVRSDVSLAPLPYLTRLSGLQCRSPRRRACYVKTLATDRVLSDANERARSLGSMVNT